MNARYRSLVLPLAVVAAACSTGVEANVDGAVNLGFAGFNSTSTPASGAAPQRIELGSDVIVLEKVELVLREIELKGNDDICSDDRAAADTAGTDDCNEVELGPMIVDLPLDGSVDHAITAQVAEGVYDEIEFEVRKPEDDTQADLDFIRANPQFEDISIRVTGTWNGEPFTYVSRRGFEQEVELSSPLVLGTGSVDLTLSVDLGRWFANAGATGLVDPRLALDGLAFESLVENNIRASFEAFEDGDHDGHDDHGGPSSDD
jgi:hypothetical protein